MAQFSNLRPSPRSLVSLLTKSLEPTWYFVDPDATFLEGDLLKLLIWHTFAVQVLQSAPISWRGKWAQMMWFRLLEVGNQSTSGWDHSSRSWMPKYGWEDVCWLNRETPGSIVSEGISSHHFISSQVDESFWSLSRQDRVDRVFFRPKPAGWRSRLMERHFNKHETWTSVNTSTLSR